MKTLNNYINEALIGKHTKLNLRDHKYFPKNIHQLRKIIKERLEDDPNADLNDINVSEIETFTDTTRGQYKDRGLFEDLDPHKIDISLWDVSNVTSMRRVFFGCHNLVCDISEWNVSNVTSMSNMFYDCSLFDCDLSRWKVTNCESFFGMFVRCYEFLGKGLDKWDISNAKDVAHMFNDCKKLNINLSNWRINAIKEWHYMFKNCETMIKNNLIPDCYTWKQY